MTRAQIVWTVVGSAMALMATSSSAAWIVSRTIVESEARLRTEIQTGIRTVNERIDALDDTMNQRIDALNDSVNQRIHSVNQRLDAVLLDDGR